MKTIHTLFAGLAGVAVIGLGAATASLAQPAEAPPGQGGPQRMMRMDPAQMAAHRQEMQTRRAARLRAVLQLRQEQEPALQAFLTAMAPPEGMMGHRMRGGSPGGPGGAPAPLTTPQRLDRQAQMMTQHQQAFQRRAEAIRRFYAQLSPAQQQAFDALHQGGRRGGPGGGMRGHHRGGPGGPGMGGPGMGGPGGGPGMGPGFTPDGDDF